LSPRGLIFWDACAKSQGLRDKTAEAIFRIDLAAKLVDLFRSPERRHSAGAFIGFMM